MSTSPGRQCGEFASRFNASDVLASRGTSSEGAPSSGGNFGLRLVETSALGSFAILVPRISFQRNGETAGRQVLGGRIQIGNVLNSREPVFDISIEHDVVDFRAAKGYVRLRPSPSGDAFAQGSGLISPTRIRYEAAPASSIIDATANAR